MLDKARFTGAERLGLLAIGGACQQADKETQDSNEEVASTRLLMYAMHTYSPQFMCATIASAIDDQKAPVVG